MTGKLSFNANYIATVIIRFTLYGCLGIASIVVASNELSASVLAGHVYADLDFDGYRDLSEGGIPNVEIVLTKPSVPDFSVTAVSNWFGFYEFPELDSGIYSITQPIFPLMVRNVFVRAGGLRDMTTGDALLSDAGTAVLLDQSQGLLPHVEGIDLPDNARGSSYNFGQISFGKAWFTSEPPPIVPQGGMVPEPSALLLLTIGALLLGSSKSRRERL